MSGRVGSITTGIIEDGLVFNMDAANRASYPVQRTFATAESGSCYNTIDLSQSGSFISDPEFVTQPISASSWVFDGIDDYIDCGDLSAYDNGDLSFSVWVYKTTSALEYCFSNASTGTVAGIDIVISGANIYMTRNTRTVDLATGYINMGFTDNVWHYIVGSYTDSPTTLKCYVDGVLKYTKVGSTGQTNDPSYDFLIGKPPTSSNYLLIGNIANVHIYNRALSSNEVLHNYNALKGRFS